MVDDRSLEEARELAGARHGEGGAAQVVGRERSRAGALGERRDLRAELLDRLLVRAAHDGHDEPVVRLHRDADVVAIEVEDRVAVEARVQLGELDERLGARLDDGREQAVERNVLEVALLDPGDRRHLAVRARHVLGDDSTDATERLSPSLGFATGRAPRTSSSVMRPPGPEPEIAARSTPSSCAIRRTTGVACTRARAIARPNALVN